MKTSLVLDLHRAFLNTCLEQDPNPIATKDYPQLRNTTGTELIERGFVQLLRHPDGRTKMYLITQRGHDYYSEIVRYVLSEKPTVASYNEVLTTFQLEGRDELYFALVLHQLETGQMNRPEVETRLNESKYPQARAVADLLNILIMLPPQPSPRQSVSATEVRRGVALTPFDSENLKTICDYLDTAGIDGSYSNGFTYALQVAAQLVKQKMALEKV